MPGRLRPTIHNCQDCGEILFDGHRHGADGFRVHKDQYSALFGQRFRLRRRETLYAYYVCSRAPFSDVITHPNGVIGVVVYDADWREPERLHGRDPISGGWIAKEFNSEQVCVGFKTRLDAELFVLDLNHRELLNEIDSLSYRMDHNDAPPIPMLEWRALLEASEIASTEHQGYIQYERRYYSANRFSAYATSVRYDMPSHPLADNTESDDEMYEDDEEDEENYS